jgi:hypothetical protein
MRRPLVIYYFATAAFGISLFMRKIRFSFLSVYWRNKLFSAFNNPYKKSSKQEKKLESFHGTHFVERKNEARKPDENSSLRRLKSLCPETSTKNDRTAGAVCNDVMKAILKCRSSGWFRWSSDLKTLLKSNSHDCTLALILESGWQRTSLSMSCFRDKQRTLVNTVCGPCRFKSRQPN